MSFSVMMGNAGCCLTSAGVLEGILLLELMASAEALGGILKLFWAEDLEGETVLAFNEINWPPKGWIKTRFFGFSVIIL